MKNLMQKIKFDKALLGDQWHEDVTVDIDDHGLITQVGFSGEKDGNRQIVRGFVLPGMPNVHSHAFQRAMAGLAEYSTGHMDSFWTWREVMYRFARKIGPDDLYDIARQLYLEMVMAGYTSVCEFHYLHHQPGDSPYGNRAEMSWAIMRAAEDVGIALTHLPVLYMSSDFGGAALHDEQARFGHGVGQYCHLLDQLYHDIKGRENQRLGVAFHSLRAVPPKAIDQVISHMNGLDDTAPLHIHIAEQMKEVEACLDWSGRRPVEWLLDHQPLDDRWCLVHATHMTDGEITGLARSGAVVAVCPTTEANLGDGFFPLKDYLDQGGQMAIGSDSHISVSPVAELRLLEYGQRLKYQQRNIAANKTRPHTGHNLYLDALQGGRAASGLNSGVIEVGKRADFIILDAASPLLAGGSDDHILDRFIFSGNVNPVRDVMIGGKWVVRDKKHAGSEMITGKFNDCMARIL